MAEVIKSESIDQLALALCKLQGEIGDVSKDRKGYGYTYADLSSVLEVSRPLLCKHDLSITQIPGCDGDKISVVTILMHKSGQYIGGELKLPVERTMSNSGKYSMSMAQAAGSVITYARRYMNTAILNITQADNDGAAEDNGRQQNAQMNASVKTVYKTNTDDDAQHVVLNKLKKLIKEKEISIEQIDAWLQKAKVNTLDDLSFTQMNSLIKMLEKKGE